MKKHLITLVTIMTLNSLQAQQPLTPEKLWQLHRVSAVGLSQDTQYVLLSVNTPNVAENTFSKEYYKLAVKGGVPIPISQEEIERATAKYNPNEKERLVKLIHKEVKIEPVLCKDFYADLEKSSGRLYSSLDHRHWDTWNEGKYNHVFIEDAEGNQRDLMQGLPFYCPQVPFGGSEDYIWSPDGQKVLFVTKAKAGTAYVLSTNTDIYEYNLNTMKTKTLTEGMMGYDTNPQYSKEGVLAWMSMAHDGNEADKNDLYILKDDKRINLTAQWDNTVSSYRWSNDGKQIYLIAPTQGTEQLFVVDVYGKDTTPKQLTKGVFDVSTIVGQSGNLLVVMLNDMNRAGEVYTINLKEKKKGFLSLTQLSHFNDEAYRQIAQCPIKERIIKTTDGKNMHAWVIYPPDFDPNKKYPTLLYCQGGPQSIVSQFYSFRWNFQLMASQGYIVIAPNRRGLPGFGVEWNAQISGDWGGQPMRDYLSAIDDLAKEPYVDKDRLGAVGASYGGYSIYYLAGIHQKRFKSFIAHCGVFNLQSMYGTTEELFFNNHEIGGAYWEKENAIAQKSYKDFNPIEKITEWDTPILIIHGGKDYRVPEEQGFQAFTAAQLRGIKSEFLYFPDENHWVLQPQNGLLWQRTFFKWLKETLK
ncbi:MAG: S9 family peptidase [Capnocytophaga sp.]|uniref:S9 family peptidase n=1 Tax=Capnocytophaga sp. TaxID=44737 RepID=UPI003F9EDA9A